MSSLEAEELNNWYWYSQNWLATIILKYKNAWNLYSIFPLWHGSNKELNQSFKLMIWWKISSFTMVEVCWIMAYDETLAQTSL